MFYAMYVAFQEHGSSKSHVCETVQKEITHRKSLEFIAVATLCSLMNNQPYSINRGIIMPSNSL